MLFLLVHAEGDADGEQQLRVPVADGLCGAELRLLGALAAVQVDHSEVPNLAELVIGHASPRHLLAGGAKFSPQLVGFVLIEGEQQGSGRDARFDGLRLVLPRFGNGVQFWCGDGWRPAVHPLEPEEPGLGANFLRGGHLECEGHLHLLGEFRDLFAKPAQPQVHRVELVVGEQFLLEVGDGDPALAVEKTDDGVRQLLLGLRQGELCEVLASDEVLKNLHGCLLGGVGAQPS